MNTDDFQNKLFDCAFAYPELAGFHICSVDDDSLTEAQLDQGFILPSSGDLIVLDVRQGGGFFGISHEEFNIEPVELTDEAIAFYRMYDGHDPSLASKQMEPSTEELWLDLTLIADVFSSTNDSVEFKVWYESRSQLLSVFEQELPLLADDPHYAIFWLVLFGLLLDAPSYSQVLAVCLRDKQNLRSCQNFFSVYLREPIFNFELARPYHGNIHDYQALVKNRLLFLRSQLGPPSNAS